MTNPPISSDRQDEPLDALRRIREWGSELGFQSLGFTGIDLSQHETYLERWLSAGYHGEMGWMAEHGKKRSRPADLVPDTCTVISARMDYLPQSANPEAVLEQSEKAYISRYALGRDYHKLIRSRLAKLAKRIASELGGGHYRAFVDSAPVLERALAENAGLGWIGKNTMLLNDKAGSWFFLGEIYTDVPLPIDVPQETQHCGSCTACLEVCPTQAFVGPWVLDARKCISYLTIEHPGAIPEALRSAMGNRIYGSMTANWYAPGISLLIQRASKTLNRGSTSTTSLCWSAFLGTRRPFSRAPKDRQSGESGMSDGGAILPLHWVMPKRQTLFLSRFKARWKIRPNW